MDRRARVGSDQRMTDHAPFAARFSYGRLFADVGRVLARAWLAIAIGLGLGAVPLVLSALPWWSEPTYTPAFPQIWMAVTLAKTSVVLIAYASLTVFVAAVALKALGGATWREMLRPRRLALGFITSLSVNLLANWATLASPVATVYARSVPLLWGLSLLPALSVVLIAPIVGVAVSASVAEEAWVGPAIARSFRLLRGLRWRIVSLMLGYLLVLFLSEYSAALGLALARVVYRTPGLGYAALSLTTLPVSALFDILVISFFVQARRIADGPSVGELHEVFA